MAHGDLNRLKDLKILRKNFTDRFIEKHLERLREFSELIKNWKDELPNLRDTFRSEEIDWFLSNFMKYGGEDVIIGFVVRTGYKDEVPVDEAAGGEQLSLRTTPLHFVPRRYGYKFSKESIRDLFKIYDRFDVNYTDEFGWSHFHVACMSGCEDAVRKFLECGQNINCVGTYGHSPLHLALRYGHKEVAELLLRKGARLDVVNEYEMTPLHYFCWRVYDDDFAELLFKIMDEQHQLVEINAQSEWGFTPLNCAAQCRFKKAIELLMRKGADPNLVDIAGETPLHKIWQLGCDEEAATFMKFYFDMHDEVYLPVKVKVNTQNEKGWTPLHWAVLHHLHKTAEVLIRRGADPNLIDKERWSPLHIIFFRHNGNGKFLKKFFEICAEKHHKVHIDAHGAYGQTPLQFALARGNIEAAEFLLRNGADPTLDDDSGWTPLHFICNGSNDDKSVTLLKKFFDIIEELNQVVDVNALDEWGNPPLYLALKNLLYKTAGLLLRRGADPKLIAKNLSLLMHSICSLDDQVDQDEKLAKFLKIFFEICAEKHDNVEIDAQDEDGDTLLHTALFLGHKKVVEVLLRNGANPNLVDNYGRTPLHHVVCECRQDDESTMIMLQTFFDLSDEVHRSVEVDTLDKDGETPLHSSLGCNYKKKITELLLRRGADPNFINKHGQSPLHSIIECTPSSLDNAFVERFFMICDEVNRVVQVDVRDQSGETPLQLALDHGNMKVAKLLLERGANPNLADEDGMTYLHNLCDNWLSEVALLKTFFEINDSAHKTVQVDARDKRGRTPLQLAVSNLMAHAVEILLNRGADLSSFIFPSESDFDESFEHMNSQVELAYGALSIVEILEERGYELIRSDALAIMKTFAKFKFFGKSKKLECWYDYNDEKFTSKAKAIMINPNLSFKDLIQLRPEEAAKLLTPMNYYKFLDTLILPFAFKTTIYFLDRFHLRLAETMSRGFFRSWALDPFLKLTHNRFQILSCELIIQNLNNEDLYNICLAAEISANEENQNT